MLFGGCDSRAGLRGYACYGCSLVQQLQTVTLCAKKKICVAAYTLSRPAAEALTLLGFGHTKLGICNGLGAICASSFRVESDDNYDITQTRK